MCGVLGDMKQYMLQQEMLFHYDAGVKFIDLTYIPV